MAHKRLGFMQLTIMVGFSLYYAWYLITFFGLFLQGPPVSDFTTVHLGQVAFFAGSVIATVALIASFDRANSVAIGHLKFLFLASLIPGMLLPVAVIVEFWVMHLPQPIFYAASFLSGASAAFGFMLWEDVSTHGYLNRGVLAHGTIFCAGGVLFLLCAFMLAPAEAAIVAMVLLWASTALLVFIAPRCDSIEDKPVEPVRAYFKSTWHIDIVIIVINTAFGYAFVLLYHQSVQLLLIAVSIAIAADLAFSIAFGRGKWVVFAGWARICAAVASCALLLMIVPGEPTQAIALCTLVVFWFIFRTMNGGSITDLANHKDFSALYSSTRGKLPANTGFALGLIVGLGALYAGNGDMARLYVPLALTALFILTALFLLPFDDESPTAGYKTLALVDMHEPAETSMKQTCQAMTTQFKLSPRESEVLSYLVKGRNAKHIAEKLYLSESTVKTHISNVYRKVGVHSQQELLDAIEKM